MLRIDPALIPEDLGFILLLFVLFVIPKVLQRWRIPAAVTSLLLGALAGMLGWVGDTVTLQMLSTFGIVALFLFAGLEIDFRELRQGAPLLVQHGALWTLATAGVAWATVRVIGLPARDAALVSLAVMTPSTGFILSSLDGFGLENGERFAVKSKAIASELVALAALFFVLQTETLERFALAVAALLGVVVVIPMAFRAFAANVAPWAPRSEFAFLLMVAVICAWFTRRLGVYYLVGAFVVGVAAQRFRSRHPAMSSEKMIDALEAFASVFIPFYFFRAGMHVHGAELSGVGVGLGAALFASCVPLRVGLTALHRRMSLGESFGVARRVAIALVPTLVFTLVIVELLRERDSAPPEILGALTLYAVLTTMVPTLLRPSVTLAFENPSAGANAPRTLES